MPFGVTRRRFARASCGFEAIAKRDFCGDSRKSTHFCARPRRSGSGPRQGVQARSEFRTDITFLVRFSMQGGARNMARYGWLDVTGIAAALLITGQTSAFAQQAPQAGPATPPTVETAAVKLAPVTREAEFVGSIAGIQQVQLVARVEGSLDSVNFTEGSFVQADSADLRDREGHIPGGGRRQAQATLERHRPRRRPEREANLKIAGHQPGPPEGAGQDQCRCAIDGRPGAGGRATARGRAGRAGTGADRADAESQTHDRPAQPLLHRRHSRRSPAASARRRSRRATSSRRTAARSRPSCRPIRSASSSRSPTANISRSSTR